MAADLRVGDEGIEPRHEVLLDHLNVRWPGAKEVGFADTTHPSPDHGQGLAEVFLAALGDLRRSHLSNDLARRGLDDQLDEQGGVFRNDDGLQILERDDRRHGLFLCQFLAVPPSATPNEGVDLCDGAILYNIE